MSAIELRALIAEEVNRIDDVEFLEGLRSLIESERNNVETIAIPEWQKRILDESRHQIARGESNTHEQVFKELDEWLGK